MKNLFLFCFVIHMLPTFSQNVDYNAIVIPESITDISIEERLVQLAWKNNPANRILRNESLKARSKIAVESSTWFNIVRAQFNFNEFNITPSDAGNNFFPRYNIGIGIPLGIFSETSNNVKIARKDYENSLEQLKLQKLSIRAEVLRRYQEYLLKKQLLQLSAESLEESQTTYSILESQFRNGTATIDEYNSALNNYNEQKIKNISAQSDFNISKINLEEIIGIRIETIE